MKISPGFWALGLVVLGSMVADTPAGAQNRLALLLTGPIKRDIITGRLTYTINVLNRAPSPVSDVHVTDILPASVQFLSATSSYGLSPTISTNEPDIGFFFPRINGSDTAQMMLTVLPAVVGVITNTVSLSAPGMTDDVVAANRFTVRSIQVSIHDPAMAREGGTYYLFSSGPGITFYSSRDMKNWEFRGRVFPGDPSWAKRVTSRFDGHVWAPDISYHKDRYYLYYAVSSPGQNSSAIGVTINKTLDPDSPDYQWEDEGIVLQSVPGRDLWNAIDPNIIVDENGTPWMDFGSFWSGIKLVKLDSTWTALAKPQEWYSLARRERSIFVDDRTPGPAQIEGPFIFKKGDYYYLFVSWGLCCRGVDSTYKIMMGRSKNLQGPYLDKEGGNLAYGAGSLLLAGDKDWPGRGGNSVYTFDGKDYIVFHAYEAADNGLQKLMIAELKWDATQWPAVDEKSLKEFRSGLVK